MPTRWTFTAAIRTTILCPSAALRHPGFACIAEAVRRRLYQHKAYA
ncbi:MAG: hypothetical protein ACO37F_01990 [Pirellulales bacterium]